VQEDPSFQRNRDFWRDMFNVVVGISWQVALVALPIYHRDPGYQARPPSPGSGRSGVVILKITMATTIFASSSRDGR